MLKEDLSPFMFYYTENYIKILRIRKYPEEEEEELFSGVVF